MVMCFIPFNMCCIPQNSIISYQKRSSCGHHEGGEAAIKCTRVTEGVGVGGAGGLFFDTKQELNVNKPSSCSLVQCLVHCRAAFRLWRV
jgi:hypothetical protein